jgi:hypothetical protein
MLSIDRFGPNLVMYLPAVEYIYICAFWDHLVLCSFEKFLHPEISVWLSFVLSINLTNLTENGSNIYDVKLIYILKLYFKTNLVIVLI